MTRIPGATYRMGSDDHYPEERPARSVSVDGFWIDETPVTNEQFKAFVAATGYVTFAERLPDPADYPGILPEMIHPGSLLFTQPERPVAPVDFTQWWSFAFYTCWHRPYGPDSSLADLEHHPVVHVAYEDAVAYADWAGKQLPSEAQWELAARGGLDGSPPYAWGDELAPNGEMLANYWQGDFPHENLLTDGYTRTSPVGVFPPNGFGLFDMIGNVWEWTDDWYTEGEPTKSSGECCVPHNPRGGEERGSYDPCTPEIALGRKTLKGGSHLCAENYCQRYRPAARYPQPIDTSTSHVGFRCAISGPLHD